MMKSALIIKNRVGLSIISVLLMTFTFVMAYAGEGRFAFSDLTATDKATGLMWTRDANIAKEGKGIEYMGGVEYMGGIKYMEGPEYPLAYRGMFRWKVALKFIEKLNKQRYAGYSDWRLPKIEELKTLLDYAKEQGYKERHRDLFSKIGFRNVEDYYWSSSTYAGDTAFVWLVYMDDGKVGTNYKTITSNVWPVRGGK